MDDCWGMPSKSAMFIILILILTENIDVFLEVETESIAKSADKNISPLSHVRE